MPVDNAPQDIYATNVKVTRKQNHVLQGLERADRAVSIRELTDLMDVPVFRSEKYSEAEVRTHLRALIRKGLASKGEANNPVRYSINHAGRQA